MQILAKPDQHLLVQGCTFATRVFYLYAIKKDGLIVYVPKKFDLSSVSKLEKLFSLTPFCLFTALTV